MKRLRLLALVVSGLALAACASNGTQSTPGVTQANLGANVLQFAVGTANIGATNSVGLNTVETYRQPNGNSATLANTPNIVGPPGFVVPAAGGTDAGTNQMTGILQTNNFPAPPADTFGQSNGVFSYGIQPFNSNTTGSKYAGNPSLNLMPFFGGAAAQRFVGGPPAYPYFNDGTYPAGFQGYSQGFADFNVAPVAGTYTLNVQITPANAPLLTVSQSANLTNVTPLPPIAPPTFVPNASMDGGGSGVVIIPADPRIVETMVYIRNLEQGVYYAVGPISGNGIAAPYTLPNNLGLTCTVNGCQPSPTKAPSFLAVDPATGGPDTYRVTAISYDYPMFEASPPGNRQQAPVIVGAGGQADLTSSKNNTGSY